jgi:hypothetical protein
MNIEAQNSLGRARSRQYDPGLRRPVTADVGSLANQYGWKVGNHIPLVSGTAQLSGPTDWANATLIWRKITIVRPGWRTRRPSAHAAFQGDAGLHRP